MTPIDEPDNLDACCGKCGSLFHGTAGHDSVGGLHGVRGVAMAVSGPTATAAGDPFPPGYDPAEADRLIGRDPDADR